jgi:ribosomal protein L35AE/L33A
MGKEKTALVYVGKSEIFGEIENELQHIVYDLSIEDINERKAKAKLFDNANEAAAYLGVKVDVVFKNRIAGKKIKGINNRMFAVRIIRKK